MITPVRTLERVSTGDALIKDLRDRILDGDFGVARPLREVELAAQYGVGRHTLRAAFRILVHDGLLRHEPFRGVSVPRVTEDDVLDLFRVRRLVELEGLAAILDRGTVPVELEAAVAALEALPESTPWSRLVGGDMAVHRVIVTAAGSRRLDRIMRAVDDEMRLAIAQLWSHREGARELAARHRALLDIVRSGDRGVALAALRDHLAPPAAD